MRLREVPGLIALAMIVSLWTLIVEDLGFWDEASYMTNGMNGVGGSFTGGAIYSDIYWVLSRAIHDPVNLYFAGRMLTATIFVLAVWGAIRLHASPRVAWSVAAVAAVIPVAHAWPGVANPAAAIVLLCVAAIFRWPTPIALAISAGALWVAAGARPELVYLALLITAWALVWAITRTTRNGIRKSLGTWIALGWSMLVLLILIRLHGTPFDSSRSWNAFGQHYGIRAHLPGEDNWYQWDQVMQRDFPGATGVTQAFTTSPGLFFKHIFGNIAETPADFIAFLLPDFPFEHPARLLATIMLLALAAAVVYILLARPRDSARAVRRITSFTYLRAHVVPLAFLALNLVFLFAAVIVIYPREHYLLGLVGLAFLLVGALIAKLGSPPARYWTVVLPQTVLFTMFALLTVLAISGRVSNPPAFASTVRSLTLQDGIRNYLAIPSELANYTDRLVPVNPQPLPTETFQDFLARNNIGAVLATDRLRIGPWSQLKGLDEFIKDPQSAGFKPVVPNSLVFIH